MQVDEARAFCRRLVNYLSNLPDDKKRDMLYLSVFKESEKQTLRNLSTIIGELQILDIKLVNNAIQTYKLENKKKAMRMLLYDKPFYNREDLTDFEELKDVISASFKELGTRSTKKTLLSSKEKTIWICVCGQSNDSPDEKYCNKCGNDIYGFYQDEVSPEKAIALIDQKTALINQFIA
jgi:CDGSH-type Zn-finger protein